jgi:HrpA-like RNA helicase
MNPEAQESFLAQQTNHSLQSVMGDGLKDFILNGGLSETGGGSSGDPMKALLVSSLLKHPKTQVAGRQPKMVDGGTYNDLSIGGGREFSQDEIDPDLAIMVKRGITRGKYNLNYQINSPAMQEKLAMLQNKHDIVLVTGGFEFDKLPYLAQQTLRNLDNVRASGGSRVLVLVHDQNAIDSLKTQSLDRDIKYLTHQDALDLELNGKLSSSFGAIILADIQVRTIAVDLWLYLIKSGRDGGRDDGREYLLVSHGLQNKSVVNYLGQIGILNILREKNQAVQIFNNYVLTAKDRAIVTTSNDGTLFWNAIYGRVSQALKKIYTDGYRSRDGNTIVFLPNQRSIRECFRFLQESLGDLLSKLAVYQANNGDIIKKDQGSKIIVYLTTEIPSIVPRVAHVIDSGLKIIRDYDPESRIHSWKLSYLDEITAKEREALASISVFKLYQLSSMEAGEKVEMLRSPSISKYFIKLLADRRVGGKKELLKIMTRDLITPMSRDRFLDFWEPLEDMGLIKRNREKGALLTFLAKDCFSPLDLDLELCAVLLMGRNVVQDQELLAQIVAILNIGGSVQGNWIYNKELFSQFQDNKGDLFGLARLVRTGGNMNGVNERNIEKVRKMTRRIVDKLQNLDQMCVIVPDDKIVGETDIDKIVQILINVYGDKHLVENGKLTNGKSIKLKSESKLQRRGLALELKELSEFKEKSGTLYGNMVVNLL